MVVEGSEGVVFGEVLRWVAGTPFLVHHLDVECFVGGDAEVCFGGSDALEGGGVVNVAHGVGVTV